MAIEIKHPTLDDDQIAIVNAIVKTLKAGQSTSLSGPAGSGKSEIIRAVKIALNAHLPDIEGCTYKTNGKGNPVIERINVLCCTPTHAARVVLNGKGLQNVFTIHAAISTPKSKTGEIETKEKEISDLVAIPPDQILDHKRDRELKILNDDLKELLAFDYSINEEALASRCNYIIVDEASMVNNDLALAVNVFGAPVLWVGDTMQLPPVGSNSNLPPDAMCNPYFTRSEYTLEKIYRQDGGSILRLAGLIRKGAEVNFMRYGDIDESLTIHNETVDYLSLTPMTNADLFVAHKNITVDRINRMLRLIELSKHDDVPMQGDLPMQENKQGKLSVLPHRSDKFVVTAQHGGTGLHNGAMITLEEAEFGYQENMVRAFIVRENGTKIRSKATGGFKKFNIYIGLLNACYKNLTTQQRKDVAYNDRKLIKETDALQLTFGRCVTVHKAQGRGADHVVVIDDYNRAHDDYQSWLYTAVTRASKKLEIFI